MQTCPLLRNLPRTAAWATCCDVGVREDDERGVTAQLETEPLDLIGRPANQLLADLGRPGKTDLAHRRVLEEHVGDRARRADHEVGDALGNPSVGEAVENLDHGERRLVGGPAHDRAPGGESRRDFAARKGRREIPGRDRAHDAHRMLDGVIALDDIRVGMIRP